MFTLLVAKAVCVALSQTTSNTLFRRAKADEEGRATGEGQLLMEVDHLWEIIASE
jgi:hypothetical protein